MGWARVGCGELVFFFFPHFFLVHPSSTWLAQPKMQATKEEKKKDSTQREWLNVMWSMSWVVSPSRDWLQSETKITSHLIWMTGSHSHLLSPLCSTVVAAIRLSTLKSHMIWISTQLPQIFSLPDRLSLLSPSSPRSQPCSLDLASSVDISSSIFTICLSLLYSPPTFLSFYSNNFFKGWARPRAGLAPRNQARW